ncbi:hypothetical protein N7499_001404 [Penicillium canescens]|uniref:Uncharacterized protein n=1 Tax=Penicillium canescens TaxID=5083 RepID=A0AAD6I5M4_PENCN|nr:uncharacterized protein N7446_008945 [Penicillium canescens]KAJ6034197.1 hypothetical protein N7460_008372 [Penicillium canescens]KAJ6045860.1 hypothetical protein N7444_007114 [Penicillium canescens]KAJ6052933.1 hypothetical protein N7446_008945 [Penicillium canescens]KAJ6097030.1 hypothetical protein N7499_001404 [Penicillium canescens]KAJ6165021.1 hypothetical protein N7485_008265 [Penicillium canescens]
MAVRKRFINPSARRESPNQSAATHRGIEASPNSNLFLDKTQETVRPRQMRKFSMRRRSLVVNFFENFSSGSPSSLSRLIYSGFALHSLTGLASVIASLISALVKFPDAKHVDIWGQLRLMG